MTSLPLQFRAFDNKRKAWLKNFVLRYDGVAICNILETDGTNITVTQATGMVDKHGKAEFCGDVLKIKAQNEFGSFQEVLAEVYFDKLSLSFKTTDLVTYKYEIIEEEVIGNIFDNPELTLKTRRPVEEIITPHGEKNHQ